MGKGHRLVIVHSHDDVAVGRRQVEFVEVIHGVPERRSDDDCAMRVVGPDDGQSLPQPLIPELRGEFLTRFVEQFEQDVCVSFPVYFPHQCVSYTVR